jgi:hypothetical protein
LTNLQFVVIIYLQIVNNTFRMILFFCAGNRLSFAAGGYVRKAENR